MAEINNIKKLRQRFVKDYNLPINVFDDTLFEYYMDTYDTFPHKVYNGLIEKVKTEYDGNVDKWLEYCASVRDAAIEGVMGTEEYKEFNTKNLHEYDIPNICGERSCYTEATDGKRFISIDLKKANFQALKFVGVLNDNTYEDFIKKYGGDDYIVNSKYLRQVIFGKMNPSRQIKVEKYLMFQIYEAIKEVTDRYGLVIFSMNSDEIIYEVPNEFNYWDSRKLIPEIHRIVEEKLNKIEIKTQFVEVKRLPLVSFNGTKIDAYERNDINTLDCTLKKASTTFYPQIYKLWKGKPIEKNDLVFYFENQLATFNEPIRREDNDF